MLRCILPVIGDVEVEVADVGRVFREDDVASELTRREPEGKVWDVVELEFCVNPAEANRTNHKEPIEACDINL